MAIALNDNTKINAPKPSEERYLNGINSYTSTTQVDLATIGRRYTGLTVNVNGEEYWYKNNIDDGGLIIKSAMGLSAITGSGTVNKIPVFNSSSGLTDSPLTITSGSVVMPFINGTFGTNAIGFNQGGDGIMMFLSSVAQANIISSRTNGFNLGTNNSSPLIFLINNSEKARISTTGNFSIGQSDNGVNKLQVAGSIISTAFIKSGGTSSQILLADGSVGSISSVRGIGGSGTTNTLVKFMSSTGITDSQITDDGNFVGIGSSIKSSKLSFGNVAYSGNGTANTIALYESGDIKYGLGVNTGGFLDISANQSPAGGGIRFFGGMDNTSPTERMRIVNNGNILIGTTVDDFFDKLQVNGNVRASGQIYGTANFFNYTADGLFSADARPSLISGVGNNRTIRFGYIDYGLGQYFPRIGFESQFSTWSAGIAGTDGVDFAIGRGNLTNNDLYITSGGSIGLGTNIPSSKLTIQATSTNSTGGIRLLGSTFPSDISYWSENQFLLRYNGINTNLINSVGSSYLNSNAGNLSIGVNTDNGIDKLQVSGSIQSISTSSTNSTRGLRVMSSGLNPKFEVYGNNHVDFFRDANADVSSLEGIMIHGAGTTYGSSSSNRGLITFMQWATAGNLITGIQAGHINTGNINTGVYFVNGDAIKMVANGGLGGSVTTIFVTRIPANNDTTVNIGSETAINSKFNVVSTTLGSSPFPRMTQAQRLAIASPVEGIYVHQTDSIIGLYQFTSGAWKFVMANTSGVTGVTNTIPKYNSPTTFSNSNISDDGSLVSISSNTRVFSGITGTTMLLSSATQNSLVVIGSGNSTTNPIFSVQGSQGELFSVNDSLTGSLFSVNDISGLPVIEAFSDSTILMGSFQAPSLNTTVKTLANIGVTNIYSIPTSAYTGAWIDYTVNNGTSLRAGSLISVFSGTSVQYTETSTNDIGNTSGITFNIIISGTSAIYRASGTTAGWTVKSIIRSV